MRLCNQCFDPTADGEILCRKCRLDEPAELNDDAIDDERRLDEIEDDPLDVYDFIHDNR